MEKIGERHTRHAVYEDEYIAIYEAKDGIDETEAEELLTSEYSAFPITKSNYRISGNRLTISYTVDRCN